MTSHFEREHRQTNVLGKPSNNNNDNNKVFLPGKQKHNNNPNVSAYENQRHVNIEPSNVGKTYYMLRILEKTGNKRPFQITTRSPNQYPNCKTNFDIKPIDKYKGSVVTTDDILRGRNSSQINDFLQVGGMNI